MKAILPTILLFLAAPLLAEPQTQFLTPDKLIFEANFDDNKVPGKPNWQFRKTKGEIVAHAGGGALKSSNNGGNGAFVRIRGTQTGGPLPENFIMRFSFKIEKDSSVQSKRTYHPDFSTGHRFSYGHYDAKFNWRGEEGMKMNIGHGVAMSDSKYQIKRDTWYHVTVEIKDGGILASFKDGPSYFMQHEHIKDRPQGFEFFVHSTELSYLDNIKVWSIKPEVKSDWVPKLEKFKVEKRAFLQVENPAFKTEKQKK